MRRWATYREVESYNPLDLRHLGEGIARALLDAPLEGLPPSDPFFGTGIYVIYYFGAFEPYQAMGAKNREGGATLPIYVGRAVPKGSRTGGDSLEVPREPALYNRLREHGQSIREADNLEIDDFQARYLVVAPVWVPLAEQALIRWFSPLWNRHVAGFGIHQPGGGREQQRRSLWDTLHPGRRWAATLPDNQLTSEDIVASVRLTLEGTASESA